jgi:hypothetical protein
MGKLRFFVGVRVASLTTPDINLLLYAVFSGFPDAQYLARAKLKVAVGRKRPSHHMSAGGNSTEVTD